MAGHAMAFLDGLGIKRCDVLGYSLGGMVALQMVQDRTSIFRHMILVGTAPRGGEDIMHLEKPSLSKHLQDPTNVSLYPVYAVAREAASRDRAPRLGVTV